MQDVRQYFSVTQLNEYVRMLLDGNAVLSDIWIKGEISNFTNQYRTGHMYFSVKDAGATLRVVMFRSNAARLRFEPRDGMKVLLHGRVSAYVAGGQYQFYADMMEADGLGSLYLAFEQCKARLAAEGLFDQSRKKPIPSLPRRVGVITSPTGAAIRDIINITGRRYPQGELLIFPSLVQGEQAAAYLAGGIRYFNRAANVDVIIIGRGGGSIEDLWAFNDERLAREIAASEIPVISAVGHETDFTICDFVADLRAPTPSAAAELVFPDRFALKAELDARLAKIGALVRADIAAKRDQLRVLASSRAMRSPAAVTAEKQMRLDELAVRMHTAGQVLLDRKRQGLAASVGKLEALSPLAVLQRGYAVAQNANGEVSTSADAFEAGEKITVRFADGAVDATVDSIKKEQLWNRN
ncbi:MAG: exodeoxyribonuclease VII large subunit [Ruminococcaceae bacterium]|nr:exodeoxyribonuclease VII large subunit [Oscillospiraceae bacterium]